MENKYESEKEKNKKIKLIIGIVIAIIVIIITIALIIKENQEKYYIILDNHDVIEYKNGNYQYANKDDYYDLYYNVFTDNTYLGRYNISVIDEYTHEFFFTNPSSSGMFAFSNPLLAISVNINKIEYNYSDFTKEDFNIFYDLSAKDYIKNLESLYDTSKVILDFDNDGKKETLYTVTYEEMEEDTIEISEKNYSIMYYLDHNGETYILAEGEPYYEEQSILFPNYIVRSILDVNGDGLFELLVTNRMHDEPIYEIYEFIDGKYTLVFATDLGGVYEK